MAEGTSGDDICGRTALTATSTLGGGGGKRRRGLIHCTNVVLVIFLPLLSVILILIYSFQILPNNNNNNRTADKIENTNDIRYSDNHHYHSQYCENTLGRFEATFNERRSTRQRRVSEGYQQSVIESKENKYSEKEFWDLYEPESICLSEERLGKTTSYYFTDSSSSNRNNSIAAVAAATTISDEYNSLKRYDSFGDGAKFICGVDVIASKAKRNQQQQQKASSGEEEEEGCLVYSIGSANDISFEMAVSKFTNDGCEIHTFDPTVGSNEFVGNDYAIFHPWGLGNDNSRMNRGRHKWIAKSFRTILRELNHTRRTIDILKIDCELCEWFTMPELFEDIASNRIAVNQIQIEMHQAIKRRSIVPQNITNFFHLADQAKMRIFHKERNGWGCDGYRCIEYSFVSEDFLQRVNKAALGC